VFGAFKAVFWSFFGVRKRADYESDSAKLKPGQVIAAGVISALAFVLALFFLVRVVVAK